MLRVLSLSSALILATFEVVVSFQTSSGVCPCENEALCKPITGDPVRSQEVFGFLANPASVNSSAMNWTYVTSVAWGSLESVCEAHKHGVRVILPSPRVMLTSNATERVAQWLRMRYSGFGRLSVMD